MVLFQTVTWFLEMRPFVVKQLVYDLTPVAI